MKNSLIYTLLFILFANFSFSQETAEKSSNEINPWSTTTARTIKKGRTETGLFAPLRFGLKNNMEVQVHPIWFFVMPNARIKKNWTLNQANKLQVATEHGFTYPTILLNMLAKSGTGGILPPTQKVPAILTLKNKLIVSYFYDKSHSISAKAAIEFNLLESMNNTGIQDVELLFVYPRTAVYNHFYTGEFALNFEGVFAKKIGYDADLRMFLIPDDKFTWVFEWNPKLYYNATDKFRIMVGAVVTTGNIAHEKAKMRVMPVFDLQFTMGKKNKK